MVWLHRFAQMDTLYRYSSLCIWYSFSFVESPSRVLELDFSFRLFRGTIFGTRSIFSKVNYKIFLNSPDSKIDTRVTYCESLDEFLCA